MLDAPVRSVLATPLNAAAGTLERIGVGANVVTITGFLFGLIAVGAIASEAYLTGLAFLVLNRIADSIDGPLARREGETRWGGFLDATLGIAVYLAVAFAFATVRQQNGLAAAFLMLGMTVNVVTGLAVRAFANPDSQPKHGFVICEQTETFFVFVLMILLYDLFALFAFAYGALCLVSAAARFATAGSSLSSTAKS